MQSRTYYNNCRHIYKLQQEFYDQHVIIPRESIKAYHKRVFNKDPELLPGHDEPLLQITVTTDGAYKVRGYNSRFCLNYVFEAETGQYIDHQLSELCDKCPNSNKKNTRCTQNPPLFHGDAGGMEVDNATKLFQRSIDHGFIYKTAIIDSDTAVFKAIRLIYWDSFRLTVDRINCFNHLTRNFANTLNKTFDKFEDPSVPRANANLKYVYKERFPIDTCNTIGSLYKLAIKQNKEGTLADVRKAVLAIYMHYCDHPESSNEERVYFHENCKDHHCKYLLHIAEGKNPNEYSPSRAGYFSNLSKRRMWSC